MSLQQRKLQLLQFRRIPYFIILLFTVLVTSARFYMIPEWGWPVQLLASCSQFISLVVVWHLVKRLNDFLDKRIPFEQGPLSRVILQIALSMLMFAPPLLLASALTRPFWPAFVGPAFIGIGMVLFVVMIFLFNFGFYAYYFFHNWQVSVEEAAKLQVKAAELERESFNMQYRHLKNQVNPHYLFNTLTSLDGLIQTNPDLASDFVRHMSKVYRYVLQHKESEVVSVEEELGFIGHYIELLHIRHRKGLNIEHNVSEEARERGIAMVTLQLLIDNAIKHNVVHESAPLNIRLWDEAGYLSVGNNKQLRSQVNTSNGQGLAQLRQLYGYLCDRPIIIEDGENEFVIKIPLL